MGRIAPNVAVASHIESFLFRRRVRQFPHHSVPHDRLCVMPRNLQRIRRMYNGPLPLARNCYRFAFQFQPAFRLFRFVYRYRLRVFHLSLHNRATLHGIEIALNSLKCQAVCFLAYPTAFRHSLKTAFRRADST